MNTSTYPARMSDSDAVLWSLGQDPMLRSTVLTVIELDQVPDQERLAHAVERTIRAVPRFRQRVIPDSLGVAAPLWEADPHFDLSYHVRHVSLPRGGTIDDVLKLAEPMAMQAFDAARPLWEWVFVEGLDGGRAAMIGKVHHAVTDGVGGVDMALNFFDLEPEPLLGALPDPVDAGTASGSLIAGALHEAGNTAGLVAAGVRLGIRGIRAVAANPASSVKAVEGSVRAVATAMVGGPPLSDVMTGRSLSVRYATFQISLPELRAAARATDVKINDVVLAATASGVGAYHRQQGSVAESLRYSMMVSTRTEESGPCGNDFVGVRFPLPTSPPDAEGVREVRKAAIAAASDAVVPLSKPLFGMMRRLPSTFTVPLAGGVQRSVDVISSNVAGWPVPVYLAGARVLRVVPLGPLAGAALNVTMLSHEDDVNVGVIADPAAVSDLSALVECLEKAFAEVIELGSADLDERRDQAS